MQPLGSVQCRDLESTVKVVVNLGAGAGGKMTPDWE